MKVLKIGEEDQGLHITFMQLNWNLTQLQKLIIQQLQDRYKSN